MHQEEQDTKAPVVPSFGEAETPLEVRGCSAPSFAENTALPYPSLHYPSPIGTALVLRITQAP